MGNAGEEELKRVGVRREGRVKGIKSKITIKRELRVRAGGRLGPRMADGGWVGGGQRGEVGGRGDQRADFFLYGDFGFLRVFWGDFRWVVLQRAEGGGEVGLQAS